MIKRGDTWQQSFTFRQGSATGAFVDLTGATVEMHLRHGNRLLLDLTDDLTVEPLTGTVTLASTLPDDLPLGTHDYDLKVTYADGSERHTQTMQVEILRAITHD